MKALYNIIISSILVIALSGFSFPEPFNVLHKPPKKQVIFHTSLTTEVTEASVKPIIAVLKAAPRGSVVYIEINSPGGSVEAGLEVLDAIHTCKGLVVTHVADHKMAASMAAIILMDGTVIHADPKALILFHSFGNMAKDKQGHLIFVKILPNGHNQPSEIAEMAWARAILEETCGKVMTRQEIIEATVGGQDEWFTGERVMYRLKAHYGLLYHPGAHVCTT